MPVFGLTYTALQLSLADGEEVPGRNLHMHIKPYNYYNKSYNYYNILQLINTIKQDEDPTITRQCEIFRIVWDSTMKQTQTGPIQCPRKEGSACHNSIDVVNASSR